MEFQFVIPSSNDDLLETDGNNYFVKKVFNSNEIPDLLKAAKNSLSSGDPFIIFDHFDTFFSVIENATTISVTNLLRSFDLLFLIVDKLGNLLVPFLQQNDSTGEERTTYLNGTKMIMFCMCQTIKATDGVFGVGETGTKNVGGKKSNAELEAHDWESKKSRSFIQIFNFIQLPLEKLWDPPVADETFVNMICDVVYRSIETTTSKSNRNNDVYFQILGTAIKRFNHALTFPVKILNILGRCEPSVAPIAHGIVLLHDEFGITSVFSVLTQELIEVLTADANDAQAVKLLSNFLTELGTLAPKIMIPHVATLGDEFLNSDWYILRNCILQLMGDIIACELTSEDLSEELKETRDDFLYNLHLHMMDVSAHVRSKVLQIWSHMKEENSVPLAWQHKVLKTAVERLEDKGSLVRKNSIILIKAFLERNPFAAKLSLAELTEQSEKAAEKLQELREQMIAQEKTNADANEELIAMEKEICEAISEIVKVDLPERDYPADYIKVMISLLREKKFCEAIAIVITMDSKAGNKATRENLQHDEQCAYILLILRSYWISGNSTEILSEEFATVDQTVKFLQDSIEFSTIITQAVPKLFEMIMSKTNSDVFEAIDFFTTAFLFGIRGTECGMRQMLYLVWSPDKEKRDAVTKAYKRVFFITDQQGRAHAVKVVQNLSRFFEDLTLGHYSALEVLMNDWVVIGDIDNLIIQVMWEVFTYKLENTTDNESRQALQLLVMVSKAKPSIAAANITTLEKFGIEERGLKDSRVFATTLEMLLNIVSTEKESSYYTRREMNDSLLEKTTEIFMKIFWHPKTKDFESVGKRFFDFVYRIYQTPDLITQNLIKELVKKCQSLSEKFQHLNVEKRLTQQTQQSQATGTPKENFFKLPTFLLSRLIFIFGYVATRELSYLDNDIYHNMKHRQDLKEENNKNKKNNSKRKTVSLDSSASTALKRLSGTLPETAEDEALLGATAEDNIAELILYICEQELFFSEDSIFHAIVPLVIQISKYPNYYKDPNLQQASCMTLIRFMTVSAPFCEEQLPFLMNILQLTTNIKIKCNIIIGLADFTFRFPNVIEPWTNHFYAALYEKNDEVRLTAVKMLSHLIMHEMIRVKGQISDLVLCIVDQNEEIKQMTQQFFKEIATKSNILYNVLPDIISRLSDPESKITEERYHTIMKFIMDLVKKDRQVESLVEKLCLRFRCTTEERQWRDIAFCLSLLTYTEKTIKKLIDSIRDFKDKVQVDEVMDYFKQIINQTSKTAKPELKALLTDFELRLNDCLAIKDNVDGEDNPAPSNVLQKKPAKGQPRRGGRAKGGRRNQRNDSESESNSEEDNFEKSRAAKKPVKKTTIVDSDSSSSEDVPQKKRGRNRRN